MTLFGQFIELLEKVEGELTVPLKDFTTDDFFVLEEQMAGIMFGDDEVIAKLRECGAVASIEKDEHAHVVIVRLIDGCVGTFGI